jgi:hypothetical protein
MAREGHKPASAAAVAITGWLIPGGGFWLLGQRARAVTIGTTIIVMFMFGILIAGVRVVEAPPGVWQILQKPWFIGQFFTGPLALIAAWTSRELALSRWADVISHARVAEIGTLYTAVAGMLNLLAIIDSTHRASRETAT